MTSNIAVSGWCPPATGNRERPPTRQNPPSFPDLNPPSFPDATLGIVLQPLLARIARLSRAAEGVGSAGFTPADDDVRDALGAIAKVLDRSRARIRRNEMELLARQVALERHLAEIAHDLRTPLASLLLAVQEIAPVAPPGDPAIRRALDRVRQRARRQPASGDPAATWARLGGEQPLDVREIVERLEARFRALGLLRGVEVAASVPDEPVLARGVPALAERAVANLLHNAVRHGREGGHVAIVLETAGATFELSIVDDSPGLRDGELADLREATFRSDGARPRSAGLGLAITLETARQFGWELRFEASVPQGLRVVVSGACAA